MMIEVLLGIPKLALLMIDKLSGTKMNFSELQSLNAAVPISVMLFGI